MYAEYYKLTGKPFQLTPDPDLFVETETHKRALAYLTYGLSQNEGFVVVTGEVGAGKTTLVGRLIRQNLGSETMIGSIVTSQVDSDSMLKLALSAFNIPSDGTQKADHLRAFERFLRMQAAEGKKTVLVVDEAQNLTFDALEELRMLSNFQDDSRPLLQTVLVGQPEFRATISGSPELEQLRQRVIASHHLMPMQADEVKLYIEERLRRSGWQGNPSFSDEAIAALARASRGVPRSLNNLAGRALLFAALDERSDIDAALVEDVIEDLRADNAIPDHIPARRAASSGGAVPNERLDRLERRVAKHDRVLKHLLALVSDLVDEEGPLGGGHEAN